MKTLLLLAVFAAFTCAQSTPTCSSATIPLCGAGQPSGDMQVKPQAVPTSTGNVAFVDAYLKSVTISNPTASPITFTLADRQGSPIAALGAVSIAANTTYVVVWCSDCSLKASMYWCPGGFTVLAGGAGLTWYGSWRQ
jgi:hypothetical protein